MTHKEKIMKKLAVIIVSVLVIAGLASTALAGPFFSSGDKTATGAVYVGKSTVGGGIMVTNDGTNNCTLKCYDASNSTTGTSLFPDMVCEASNGQTCHAAALERACSTGIYCVVTSAGSCTYGVGYRSGW